VTIKQEYRYCGKKLARNRALPFGTDYGRTDRHRQSTHMALKPGKQPAKTLLSRG